MPLKPKMLYIEWEDHCHAQHGWRAFRDVDNAPVIVLTVGFLIKENKKHITVATTVDVLQDGEAVCVNTMTIIKSCIRKRKVLK